MPSEPVDLNSLYRAILMGSILSLIFFASNIFRLFEKSWTNRLLLILDEHSNLLSSHPRQSSSFSSAPVPIGAPFSHGDYGCIYTAQDDQSVLLKFNFLESLNSQSPGQMDVEISNLKLVQHIPECLQIKGKIDALIMERIHGIDLASYFSTLQSLILQAIIQSKSTA
jgi:hypothetical protein